MKRKNRRKFNAIFLSDLCSEIKGKRKSTLASRSKAGLPK
jgi:hypothetical protein